MVRNRSDNLKYQDILLTTTERKRMDPMILLSSCMSNSKLQESSNRLKKISLSIRHRLSRDLVDSCLKHDLTTQQARLLIKKEAIRIHREDFEVKRQIIRDEQKINPSVKYTITYPADQ